jgi:hypothetical protein
MRCIHELATGSCGVCVAGVCAFDSAFIAAAGVAIGVALLPRPPAAAAAAAGAGTLLRAAAAAGVDPAGVRSSASELATAAFALCRAHSTAGDTMPAVLLPLLLAVPFGWLSQLVCSCGAELAYSFSSSAVLFFFAAVLRASQYDVECALQWSRARTPAGQDSTQGKPELSGTAPADC